MWQRWLERFDLHHYLLICQYVRYQSWKFWLGSGHTKQNLKKHYMKGSKFGKTYGDVRMPKWLSTHSTSAPGIRFFVYHIRDLRGKHYEMDSLQWFWFQFHDDVFKYSLHHRYPLYLLQESIIVNLSEPLKELNIQHRIHCYNCGFWSFTAR